MPSGENLPLWRLHQIRATSERKQERVKAKEIPRGIASLHVEAKAVYLFASQTTLNVCFTLFFDLWSCNRKGEAKPGSKREGKRAIEELMSLIGRVGIGFDCGEVCSTMRKICTC
jgi:hypothetical protein